MDTTIFISMIVVLYNRAEACDQLTDVYQRIDDEPVFEYSVLTTTTDSLVTYQMIHGTTVLFVITYYKGVQVGDVDYNRCSLAPSSNVSKGILHIKLDTLKSGDKGSYYLTQRVTHLNCTYLFIIGKPSKPRISVTSSSPYIGEAVTLTCNSTTNTVPRNHTLTMLYNWIIGGEENPAGPRYIYSSTKNTCTISGVMKTDAQKAVTCVAGEDVDRGYTSDSSDSTILDVLYGPENTRVSPTIQSYEVIENSTVGPIQCLSDCNPSCTFNWTKGGYLVSNTRFLQFGSVQRTNTGMYVCTARHSRGNNDYRSLNVSVIYGPTAPILSPTISEFTTTEGDTIDVICTTECWPCTYIWTGPNTFVLNGSMLHIENISREHHGQYVCTVTNGRTNQQQTVSLQVQVICPPVLSSSFQNATKLESGLHDTAVLTAAVKAFPVPTPDNFTWSQCNSSDMCQILQDNEAYIVHVKYLQTYLIIKDVKQNDFVQYKLIVSNGIGDPLEVLFYLSQYERPDDTYTYSSAVQCSQSSGVITGVSVGCIVGGIIIAFTSLAVFWRVSKGTFNFLRKRPENRAINYTDMETSAQPVTYSSVEGGGELETRLPSSSEKPYSELSHYGNTQNTYEELGPQQVTVGHSSTTYTNIPTV